MKKKLLLIFLIPILAIIVFLSLPKDTYKIAVIGPFDGMNRNGEAILEGVRMRVEEENRLGGLNGKQIELLLFDDGNDRKQSLEAAQAIIARKDILMVLGHQSSSTSLVAGRLYKSGGIPAIAASAMGERVTKGNEFFFRVISNAAFQGAYIANYISQSLHYDKVNILYDGGDYGRNLLRNFEINAQNLGIIIENRWEISGDEKTKQAKFEEIITSLRANKDPGMLVLGTFKKDSATFLPMLRGSGSDQPFFAVDVFTQAIFDELSQTPQEQAVPGFYSNGGYAITPIKVETAAGKARKLKLKFNQRFGRDPLWYTYTFYDAANVAIQAMKKAELMGQGHIRRDRLAILKSLKSFYSYENGVRGNSGRIYFDKNGDSNGSLTTVIYKNGSLIPAHFQYELAGEVKNVGGSIRNTLQGKQLLIGEKVMRGLNVVFSDIQVQSIRNIDFKEGQFEVEFQLFFRHSNGFDEKDLIFLDAVEPIVLGKPFRESNVNGERRVAYKVKGLFNKKFDSRTFPFDQHQLKIRFRHPLEKRKSLLMIPDPEIEWRVDKLAEEKFKLDLGWEIWDLGQNNSITPDPELIRRNLIQTKTEEGFSTFEKTLLLKRVSDFTLLKFTFLPFIALLLAGMTFFMSRQGYRIAVLLVSGLAVVWVHTTVLNNPALQYLTYYDLILYLTYMGILSATGVSWARAKWPASNLWSKVKRTSPLLIYLLIFVFLAQQVLQEAYEGNSVLSQLIYHLT